MLPRRPYCLVTKTRTTRTDLLATHCGTPFFAAPELFLKQAYEGPPIDVWALGVNLYLTVGYDIPPTFSSTFFFSEMTKENSAPSSHFRSVNK